MLRGKYLKNQIFGKTSSIILQAAVSFDNAKALNTVKYSRIEMVAGEDM